MAEVRNKSEDFVLNEDFVLKADKDGIVRYRFELDGNNLGVIEFMDNMKKHIADTEIKVIHEQIHESSSIDSYYLNYYFKGNNNGEILFCSYGGTDGEGMSGDWNFEYGSYSGDYIKINMPEKEANAFCKDLIAFCNENKCKISKSKLNPIANGLTMYEDERDTSVVHNDLNCFIQLYKTTMDSMHKSNEEEKRVDTVYVKPSIVKEYNREYTIAGKDKEGNDCEINIPKYALNIHIKELWDSKKFKDWTAISVDIEKPKCFDEQFFFTCKVNGKTQDMSNEEFRFFVNKLNKEHSLQMDNGKGSVEVERS